ncbi:MAG: ribosomal protein S6--L-glutamate ligase [Saprospiraceae bacterium]|jgi:ribosomal protein S6--L-glutamate ligase
MDKLNILILSDNQRGNSKKIKDKAIEMGHYAEIVSPNDFVLNYNTDGSSVIYVNEQVVKASYFDAVIPRLSKTVGFGLHVLRHLLLYSDIVTTAMPDGIIKASDKLRTTLELSKAGLRMPRTSTVRAPDSFKFLTDSVGGLPCICKSLKGSQGSGVFIFNDELQSSVTLSNFRKEKRELLLQEFIETASDDEKKNDIRAWVVGDKVVAAFKRLSTDKDFRSNYSISKEGEPVTLTKEEIDMAVKAAQAIGLPAAGVDIARDANNKFLPYIIEINSCASLTGIEEVTKVSISTALIKYVENEVAKKAAANSGQKKVAMVYKISAHSFKNKEMSSIDDIVMAAKSGRINEAELIKSMQAIAPKKTAEELEIEEARKGLDEWNEKIFNKGPWGRFTP